MKEKIAEILSNIDIIDQFKDKYKYLPNLLDGFNGLSNSERLKFIDRFDGKVAALKSFDKVPERVRKWADANNASVTLRDDVVVIGDASKQVADYARKINDDDVVDIVIHGNGNNFTINIEGVEQTISPAQLADYIREHHPGDQPIRLLSCSNLKSAQDLSYQLNRPVIATEDPVRLYEDGSMQSINGSPWYTQYPDGRKKTEFENKNKPSTGTNPKSVLLQSIDARIQAFKKKYPNYVNLHNAIDGFADNSTKISLINYLEHTSIDDNSRRTLLSYFNKNTDRIDYWKVIMNRRIDLTREIASLKAVEKIKNNPKFNELGIKDTDLGNIKAWATLDGKSGSFAEIVEDLNNLLTNMTNKNINITNFDEVLIGLKTKNKSDVKGMHWVVENLSKDDITFNGKTLELEFKATNARGNDQSRIDVLCNDCFSGGDNMKRLLVEYKHGPQSITKSTIIAQFIQRDLFHPRISSINQIQWRLKDSNLTHKKFMDWLEQEDSKKAIEALGDVKVGQLLKRNDLDPLEPSTISNAVIEYFSDSENYKKIFQE